MSRNKEPIFLSPDENAELRKILRYNNFDTKVGKPKDNLYLNNPQELSNLLHDNSTMLMTYFEPIYLAKLIHSLNQGGEIDAVDFFKSAKVIREYNSSHDYSIVSDIEKKEQSEIVGRQLYRLELLDQVKNEKNPQKLAELLYNNYEIFENAFNLTQLAKLIHSLREGGNIEDRSYNQMMASISKHEDEIVDAAANDIKSESDIQFGQGALDQLLLAEKALAEANEQEELIDTAESSESSSQVSSTSSSQESSPNVKKYIQKGFTEKDIDSLLADDEEDQQYEKVNLSAKQIEDLLADDDEVVNKGAGKAKPPPASPTSPSQLKQSTMTASKSSVNSSTSVGGSKTHLGSARLESKKETPIKSKLEELQDQLASTKKNLGSLAITIFELKDKSESKVKEYKETMKTKLRLEGEIREETKKMNPTVGRDYK